MALSYEAALRPKVGIVELAAVQGLDRRLEADVYLSSGFGYRSGIQRRTNRWKLFGDLADVWMPGRLKGVMVPPKYGTPFLAATQVYDSRPVPRKWLALARTEDAEERFVQPGQILVTCSGSVGRATIAQQVHSSTLISHDLLRVQAKDPKEKGWIYAFLRSTQARAMLRGAQYGHIIKHLEESHLNAVPVPEIGSREKAEFNSMIDEITALRDASHRKTILAESTLTEHLGIPDSTDSGEHGFAVKAAETLHSGRRRFYAAAHAPPIRLLREHLRKNANSVESLAEMNLHAWLPKRFKRIPATAGVPLFESSFLAEVNPDLEKRIADVDFGDEFQGRVKSGWLLMARSGQTYGIIGTAVLARKDLEGPVVSDDVIRIRAKNTSNVDLGYVLTAISHPILGRPLVKALAYGSSIPHIDVEDVLAHQIPRMDDAIEKKIGQLALAAAESRAQADMEERRLAVKATKIIEDFLAK